MALEIKEYPVPEPEPGAAIVRMTLANVCGSDLHTWRGDLDPAKRGRALPIHQGHEGTGRIFALGDGLHADSNGEPLGIGDRVVFAYFFPCGRCRACLNGKEWTCPNRMHYRATSCDEWPHFKGTFGDYFYLYPNHIVLKVPDSLSDEVVAGVNCAMAQVMSGWDLADLRFGETVVIQGAGGLGLYAIAVARERGAGRIIVVDGVRERLEVAAMFGADEFVDLQDLPTPEQRIRRVRELTDGFGVHSVLECVGLGQSMETAIRIARPGGAIGRVGVPQEETLPASRPAFYGNLTIGGGPAPVRAYITELLPDVLEGRIEPGRVFDRGSPRELIELFLGARRTSTGG